jgi:alanine racemase
MISSHVKVTVDLGRVRRNAEEVAARAGVPVWATIKADAYGLGAGRVAGALAGVVEGFCVFALAEAEAIDLWKLTGKPAIALGPPETLEVGRWIAAHVRPAVSTVEQARALAEAGPLLCVDTGMQRFACPAGDVAVVLEAGGIREAFTHATRVEHVRRLREVTAGRALRLHAAATALLDEAEARLDSVRPALALYRAAVRTSARLADVRRSAGAIGYGGWRSESGFHGVILAGYSHGRRQRITEIGMQSAYVTLDETDRLGDEVALLGEGINEAEVGFAWEVTPHQVVLVMAGMGEREYVA